MDGPFIHSVLAIHCLFNQCVTFVLAPIEHCQVHLFVTLDQLAVPYSEHLDQFVLRLQACATLICKLILNTNNIK